MRIVQDLGDDDFDVRGLFARRLNGRRCLSASNPEFALVRSGTRRERR
jgi:hypothetical protein